MPPTLVVSDLDKEIESYIQKGYRLDMIIPADSPRVARISKNGQTINLESSNNDEISGSVTSNEIIVTRLDDNEWIEGRAGMQYRDLIPGRLGGRFIASHIRLVDGGEVPDYVHYHKVRFQMIYCKSGWIRVVYEDQGQPFVPNAGDCVLQPPEIRHRVLESSAGAEVIEIGCPAVHETWVDHEMQLPTPNFRPERPFNGQHFVRHIAADAKWERSNGVEACNTGISAATNGFADVQVCSTLPSSVFSTSQTHSGDFLFYFVLNGELIMQTHERGSYQLKAGDSCLIPKGIEFAIKADSELELLEVSL
jgi:quercetin dioxygenase-like cupin family protein